MKRQIIYLISISIVNLFLFGGVFKLLQYEKVYNNTLGLISWNYERTGEWDDFEIHRISAPFLAMENDNFETWDAGIYKCISEKMYSSENVCYGSVRAAFFPLFPLLWKITNSSPIGISIINYFIFIASVVILILSLVKTAIRDQSVSFALLIALPSTVIYSIPYTESLFLLTTTVSVIGIVRKKYWMFAAGSLLLSMVRPATVFVLIALLLTELVILLKDKNYRRFLVEAVAKSAPFLTGYFCTFLIQYMYTGSWTAFLDAQKFWSVGGQPFKGISDWSSEGFGLSCFSLFFVCIPAILFVLFLVTEWNRKKGNGFLVKIKNYSNEYLFLISVFYLIGIFIFTLITSGGNLHSFFRFTIASPFFYIALLIFLNYLSETAVKYSVISYAGLVLLLIVFLNLVGYGCGRLQFPFFGLYLFIASGLFLILKNKVSIPVKLVIALVLILLNTIWNTYLLNIFFSNGWIFT